MENPALEDPQPPRSELEAQPRHGRRLFVVPSAEAAAFRVRDLRIL
jgi:hypothetical protein